MALINCPECNKEISDTAKNCIHCGYVLKEENTVVQPQTVVIAPEKGKIAKNSLNIGVTIILVVTGFSLLAYLVACLFSGSFVLSRTNAYIIDVLLSMLAIPTFISVIMSILIYSKPKLRKIWFKIIYIIISIAALPLSLTFSIATLPISIAYIAGIVFVIKSMVVKD